MVWVGVMGMTGGERGEATGEATGEAGEAENKPLRSSITVGQAD